MHARVVHVLLDGDGRAGKGGVGGFLVARIPGEDMVVVVALAVGAFGLAHQVFTNDRRAFFQGFKRVNHHGEFFVLHFNSFHTIGGGVAVGGNHHRHFLHLEMDFAIGQHGGYVTGQGGHPVQLERFEVFSRQHGNDAGYFQRFFFVDAQNARMGHGRAHDVHVQHFGQLDVINIVALALDKARIFLAQAGFAQAHQGFFAVTHWCVHGVSS